MAEFVNPGDEIKAEQVNQVFDLANTANESALDSANKVLYMQQDLNKLNSAIINMEFVNDTSKDGWTLRVYNKEGNPMDIDMTDLIGWILENAKA